MPDKRTAEGVYQALSAISKEEGIDFGINEMTADAFKKKYFDKQESAGVLYDKLNALSQEEGIDFGQGTRDEWVNSFDFKPRWKPTAAQRAQFERTMSSVRQDFNTRMENIRKGNTLGKTSEVKFNPESGKMERRYYTTHGDEVATPLEQSRLNLKYRDEWEATTEEGRRHREKRIQNDFERRVGASIDKYDPDNAAAMVWQQAEDKSNEEFGRYLDERSKPSLSNFIRGAADGMNVTGGLGADNVDTGIKAFAAHLKYHDLQRMADDAWNMLGKEKQQSIIEDMYGALKNRYPQATEQQLQQAATEMAREQSDRRMYELAVAKNAPKDAAEYFIRKVAAGNAMGTLMQAAARAQAGTTGDWEAREDAEQRFEKQGHKVAGIAGTVTGFALDPLTWASAGAGGAAVKGTTWLGGKMIGEAAMRKFGATLGGRMLGGAIGGAVNFGTYEAGSEALDQMKWGGYIDEETGERKDGFSFGNVAGRAGHGLMMGAVTGVIAPYLGNVSEKLVRATESTVGKMGIRAGELGVGTVAEGTIFAVPEIINTYGQYGDLINSLSDETSPNYIADEQELAAKIEELRNSRGDALMDVWTDNMAMIAGFKAQHLLKSAPRVIYDLARSKNGKAGFETRLRSILDGRGDLALTEDEKKELERRGYGDLKDLTEEYSRYAEAKEEYDKARPTTTDASGMIEGGDGQAELPYNRFVELMTDNSVSEAARAKMYYYLTGHGLPMSTVMGSSILEEKDADGNVTGYTVQSFGANGVITSRSFGDKKRADVEANRINRQAELNGFDVGERYYDWQGDNKRMYEACESVAEETGAPANLLFDLMKRKSEAMNEVELEWAEKILNAYNGLGDKYGSSEVRAAINDEFGIDVDKAIRKERNRRSWQEQKAVDEYANRLFTDVKRKQEEAAERGEAPVDPDAPTSSSQIAALLGIDDGEQGDPVSAAFNRGHEADAQERQDIAIELADPNNAEAQEAWNGVVQRINEDAAYMVAQQREQTKQMQHTDGSLRPAILKEKDSEGNDQQVYIVYGNVQMMPDGSMVDKASSDNIAVVYNPATGERKQIDPSADTGISSLGEVTTAEQREADIERSRQEYVQAQIDEAQGTVRFVPGQQLVLPTGDEAVVVATDADGENITVALGDGTQATVQRSELQRIRDEKAAADYRQRHGITEEPAAQQPEASTPAQPQADGRVAGAPADYTADMELTIRDEDGSEKPAMVMGRVRYENGSFVPDANGNIIEYFMDGEVKHDHEDKLVDKVVSHVAPVQPEQSNNTSENIPVQGNNSGENIPQTPIETPAPAEPTNAEQAAEVAPQQVQEPVQTVEPQPAQPTEQPTAEPMPVGEDGEEDWQATTPERAHAYIFNEAGLSRSEGNEFIAAQTQAAQSALVKAKSAQMPRVGTSIKKYNEAKAKRQEKIDEAQRVLDYWQQVRNIQNDIQRVENERRAAESVQQDGTPPAVNNGSEDTGRSERSEEEIARLTHDEAITLIAQMEERADVAPDVELTIENWDAQFGEDGRVNTPIGDVKMGENQFTKLMRQGREGKLGMIKPTLETPDVIIEDASEAKEDDVAERNSSYVFVKSFKKADGSRYYYFTSVTVSKDGKEVVISNQEKRKNAIANLLTNGKLVWKHADDVSAASDVEQGLYSSQGNMSDPTTEGTDAPQTNDVSKVFTRPALEPDTNTDTSGVDSGQAEGVTTPAGNSPQTSAGKGSENSATVQEKGGKSAENQTPNAVQAALAAAEQETNTEPTEAQKEAGATEGKGYAKKTDVPSGEAGRISKTSMLLDDETKVLIEKRLEEQGDVVPAMDVKKYDVVDFVETDREMLIAHQVLGGVYHDGGFVVGTDGHALFAKKQAYHKGFEGSVMDKKGHEIGRKYPSWRSIIPEDRNLRPLPVDVDALRGFVGSVANRLKEDGVKAKMQAEKYICIIIGNELLAYNYIAFRKFLSAVGQLGVNEIGISQEGYSPLCVKSDKGFAMVIPYILESLPSTDNCYFYVEDRGDAGAEVVSTSRYTVSDVETRGGKFYQDENGNINLAAIPQEVFDAIDIAPAPFRMTTSMAEHVFEQHGKELKLHDVAEAVDFVVNIMTNFDHVRKGDDAVSFVFSIENGRRKVGKRAITIIVNANNGEFLGIRTSGNEGVAALRKRELLWEKGANETSAAGSAPANVTSASTQQGGEPTSSASNQSNSLSESKDSNVSVIKQDGIEKVSEKETITQTRQSGDKPSADEIQAAEAEVNIESARKAYLSNYEDGWRGFEARYYISPKPYTTKRGRTLDMQLLQFPKELSKEQQRAAASLARELKGWWSKEDNGFMLRSVEHAEQIVKTILDEEAVQDAQPLSVEDVATATDQADMKAASETIKVEQEPQTTPQYDYDREDDVYDKILTGLRNVLNGRKRGAIPNIKSIENIIRDLRKRAKTIEDGMATAAGETIPQAFDALANLNGRRKAYEQFLVDIRKKMAETERDDALAAHGVKLGDKIMYKGKEVTIHDADARQVTLDVGLAPVLYEVTDWEDVELPKPVKEYHGGDRVFSVKHNANKDIFVAHHKDGTVEYTFTDGTKANADEVQDALPMEQETQQTPFKTGQEAKDYLVSIGYDPDGLYMNNPKNEAQDYIDEANYQKEKRSEQPKDAPKNEQAQPKQEERKAKSKWVDDADAERFEELRRRLHMKLGGQLNMGLAPEAFAIGVEMSYLMLKHGARKFGEFAKQMIEALGENVRPYLKAFYNGARDLPEMADYEKDMTSYDEVRTFDVMNFDKEGAKDIIATAEHIVREQAAEREAKEATNKLKQERNEQRKEIEQQVAAENSGNQQENPSKERKSKKKSVSLQEQTIPDLFSGLFGEEDNSLEPQNKRDDGLQRIHAVRSEGLPAGGNQRGEHIGRRGETSGQGGEGTDRRGESGGVRSIGRPDGHVSRLEYSAAEPQSTRPAKPEPAPLAESERKNTHNNTAERGTDYAPKGTSARIEANIKAIETMQRLIEGGEPATPEDMSVLRKFSGWGGLGAAFKEKVSSGDSGYNPRLRDDYQPANPINARLRELLSPEAYEAANMSRNSAYYTPAPVIDAMWDVVRAMGFRGGNVLEGSAGIGNIIGLMPTDMSERSNIHAVEIDETTGNILSLLYPDANVEVKGFEKTFVPNGSVDLAITNVPFVTGLRVMDETGDKDLSRKFHDIHDFCIAKNVRKLKEGGVGIFITSSGTLDSPNSAKLRTWLVNEGGADVVGAFRMHNQTFGGTGATSDIIVIRKRVNGRKSANAIDVSGTLPIRTVKYNTGETKRGSSEVVIKDLALDVNKHFVEHPEDMAGEMAFAFEKGDTYRATSKALYPSPSINQEQRLSEWAQQFKDMDWDKAEERESQQVVYEDLGEDVKEGSMLLDSDGNLCLAQRGKAVPINVNANKVKGHTKAACFNAYKAIKDALADVLEYQTSHSDDSGLQQRLAKLNKAYDSFVKTYGHLNKNTSISFLRSDMDYPSIAALESVSETGDKSGKRIVTYGKTDIFSRRVVETGSEPKPTTIKDGIIASIYLNGRVDVPYIAEQLNMSDSDVRQQIIGSGLGFENPTTTEMEVSYEYLSGNVREKLRQAQENNTDGRYDANIKALERVIPMNIPAHLIEFTLGSSWVEPKLYEDFVKERTGLDVKLTNAGGTWIMSEPYYTNTEQNKAMGVISKKCDKTILGHELIKAAITCKSISVTKTISTGYGISKTTETIVDKEATMACANKIDEIRQDFKDWARGKMQGDPEMSERMERVYNELFNNSVPKEIPDDFVPEHFGGAATVVDGEPFKLHPHQAKAVIRATTQPLMLAHEVGTGKTYTLISTAMEMRRLGTARKPMIVVQNATVGQFVASAKALYPNAKILTLEDADRNAEGRRNFYAKIRYNDWDMIVVPQSVFEMIPDSEERQIRFVEDKVEEKMMVLEKMREAANDDRDPVLRQARRELDQLNDELNDLKLALQERKSGGNTEKDEKREAKTRQNAMVKAQEMLDRETDDVANFDDMGIDALLIDEAHEYKHLGFATAMQRGVKGVDPSYSKKSQGVYLKSQAVLESKNGKNVVFATGTPISNTAAEIWTFMRYLMPADTMREYGIYYFDDFVRNFGNIQQMLEFATNGKYRENNRFAGYVNLPELVRIWAGVADTVLTREADGVSDKIPKMEGEKAQDIYLPQTKALRGVMKFVKDQLDDYEKMSGKEKKENSHIPLTMYGIAKAAAVDARLVLEDAADEPNSKTNEAVRQTLRSLEDTKEYNGTVAIFADNYQNKSTGFNLYEEIRRKLIDAGVPEAQVVVMKPGMSIKKKLEIFDKVNRGEVRVIMGSTITLGTGVNIQERLHTLIHVDAPNRPMDYTQRNGRILRQGNLHNEWGIPVRVLRFGVEDSLDVTAYQRLKTKGAIADSIMEGKKMMGNSMENRVLEEEQDLFGDITAQLSGSQYALLKNQVEKEVKKLEARRKQWEADQTYVHNQKPRLKALIKDSEERAKRNKEALAKVEAAKNDGITIGKMKFPSLDAMGDYIKDYNSKQREQQEQVRTASGYKAEAKSDLTVSVGGFDFHVHRVISKEQKQEKGQLSLSFFSKTQMTYSCPELGLEDVPVDGQRLKSALEDILENVLSGDDFREKAEYADRASERYKGELQQVEARDGKPFEYADELKQAKEKLAEYEELMKAEMAEKEAKYAEMDASVEAAKGVQLSDEDSDDAEPFAEYKGVKQMKSHDGVAEEVGERERMVVEAMAEHLRAMGIETITDIEEAQRVLDEANGGASLSAKKRRALETVSLSPMEKGQQTVISSADGAKILKDLDILANNYVISASTKEKTFLGSLSVALGAHRHGSASEYATFETKNGRLVTIRLSNHNAKVSTFDNHGEEEGISIVVSPKKSGGMANDGNAHVVEYYYDAIKLRRADGKPLAAIVRSIRQALYSGEYKDTTGLAEVQEVNGRDMRLMESRVFGGNKGYVGYSKSKRAAMAEGRGLRNKSQMDKEFADEVNALIQAQFPDAKIVTLKEIKESLKHIRADEWHHTSMYGNRTNYYSAERIADYFMPESEEVRAAKERRERQEAQRESMQEEASRLREEISQEVFASVPHEVVEDPRGLTKGLNVFRTSRGHLVEHTRNVLEPSKNISLIPAGSDWLEDRYGDWVYENREEYEQSLEEYNAAKQAAYERVSSEKKARLRDMDAALGARPQYFRTGSGVAYGFTLGGKIYIDPRIATSETPVHEYVHLWSEALGRANPEAWTHLKAELANDEELVSFVRSLYPELTDGNALMHEVFSHFAGRRGRARLDAERAFAFERADSLFDKARIVTMFERLKSLLSRYWQLARDLFAGNNAKLEEMSAEDFADMAMADFMHGFNPVADVVSDGEVVSYHMGSGSETFQARQKRAVENKGTVMPGLNSAEVKVVEVPRHQYQGHDILTQARNAAIERYSIQEDTKDRELKLLHYDNFGEKFDYVISPKSLTKAANHAGDSDNIGVHAAVMDKLDKVINESIEIEEHPDIKKKDGERKWENGFNKGILMHRFVAAVKIGDEIYRVKTTMKEYENPQKANGHYTYEVTKIEVLDGQTTKPLSVSSRKSNTPNGRSNVSDVFVSGTKLLQNVEKAYDTGKKLLDESKIADESTDLFRDPDETEDIWNDQSLGLQERITAAATRLANNHRDNKTLRNDAMRAIGGNLSDLRKAMSLQRTFDMTTVKRVADLARVLMNNGYLNGLTQQEVKRLLAAVKNSVGHNDIEGDVQKVMDIMVDNQLKHAEDTLHELEAIRGSKVDARGVEVQGQLDPAGAHTMKVFKKTRGWEKTDIEEAISEAQQRMGSSDVAVADEAALEYTGLQLALEYAENIKDSKVEERKLREEIKQAHDDASERDRATDSYRQYIASLQEAIRQNKIERAQSYFDLVGRLSDSLRESIANAKDFKEAEKQRIREIQHNANSDMEGRPSDEHYKPTFADKFVNNSFVSFLFAPLATFDQMLRMFGGKSANGEGYLYNRFMRGWIDARQQEIDGVRDKYAILDAKAAELFGGKVKTWGDLIRRVGKLPKGTVSFWNGGEMQERELTQGNLMYIYMVNKMLDGRMKLRKMGITEENVADIEEVLDPRLIELADWLQDEFLVQTRNEYNETHKRMFGASMAAIEHYFPLKILANARADKPEDLDNPDKSDGISTATGSIIKRRRNALALDITGADALSVILDHVAQMEHWNAFAEFNRDINTLRTYKRFRNQVQNMTTIYGSGKELWKKFNDVCQMAAGTYRPPRTNLDKGALEFAQGVTAAKVSFRMFTALKQFLSMPAYIPEARADYLAANILNPARAWKWSMEHLPIFSERWRSRVSGDPRLAKSGMDWRDWRANLVQRAARWGMSPNAFVDALTVCIGAHAMYRTRKGQYLRDGYSEADAEKKAVQDAEILYNQTQQSSEGAFTSTMQVDRSWLSVLFTVFRNASMSYQRQLHDAIRNLKRNLNPVNYGSTISFMKKQYVRDGIDEVKAEENAKRKFRRQMLKDTLRVATFGYIMQFAWNLGAYLPYLLFGDDEDEKQKMWDDVWAHTAFGSVEGLTGGDLMSQAGQMMLTGEGNPAYLSKDMPLTSDIMAAFQKLGNGQHTEALNDMINLIVQAGLGVNPQSITDVALSIMDACGDDPALAHEATICISRILQVPQSQIDKMYFDEVGLHGSEVSDYTPSELAARYARYKIRRGRFYTPWQWDDSEQLGKYADKANSIMKERLLGMGDEDVDASYVAFEEVYKGVDKQLKVANEMLKTDYLEAARMISEARNDRQSYPIYMTFKKADAGLDKLVQVYLSAKTQEEISLCEFTIPAYRSAMVDLLNATGTDREQDAMRSLQQLVDDFSDEYDKLRSKQNEDEADKRK